MRAIFMKYIVLFTALLSCCCIPPSIFANRTATIEAIRTQLLPFLKKSQIPGAAVLIYDHGHPYAFYYGYANLRPKSVVTADTLFEIASVSKLFTTVLLAESINTGEMRLNDPIGIYLSTLASCNQAVSSIQLENLATHANGLRSMPPLAVHDKENLLNHLCQWKPAYLQGTRWHYSNMAYGLLGFALGAHANSSYWQVLQKNVLNPLRMHDTQLTTMSCVQKHCAQGYSWGGLPVNTTLQLQLIPAAGSIQASGRDMLKFMASALALPGSPQQLINAMRLTEKPIYHSVYGEQALGWEMQFLRNINRYGFLKKSPQRIGLTRSKLHKAQPLREEAVLFDKTGSVAGFRSYIVVVPSEETGITVLINRASSRSQLVAATRRALLMLL